MHSEKKIARTLRDKRTRQTTYDKKFSRKKSPRILDDTYSQSGSTSEAFFEQV